MGSVTSAKAVPGAININEALPLVPEDITAAWCSKVLGKSVKSAVITKEYHGTASKLIVELTYEKDNAGPSSICVKGGFNPDLLAKMPMVKFVLRREAEFYYYVAPLVDLRLPKPYFCTTDTVNGQGIVVMEDLSDDTEFGSPMKPWKVDTVRSNVEQLAKLHAGTWNPDESKFPWLTGSDDLGANPYKSMILALLSPAAFADRFAEGSRPPMPDKLNDRERVVAAFRTLWHDTSAGQSKFRCIIHGDPHVANTYIRGGMDGDGEPGFLDWQGLCFGHPFHDLAYFMIGALTIADRRAHEKMLVQHYLDTLNACGVAPKLQLDEVWDEYRKLVFHGFAWATVGKGLQPEEYIFAMAERHCAAIVDHGTLELLESLPGHGTH
ncbi:kinase-like domain-containing protein [Apiospora arundinis]